MNSLQAALVALLMAVSDGESHATESEAEALLREVVAATNAVRTLTGRLVMTNRNAQRERQYAGAFRLKKPNFGRLEIKGTGTLSSFRRTIASDGVHTWVTFHSRNQYTESKADMQGKDIRIWWSDPIEFFFDPSKLMAFHGESAGFRLAGKHRRLNREYMVLEATDESTEIEPPWTTVFTRRLYVSRERLAVGYTTDIAKKREGQTVEGGRLEAWLDDVQMNRPAASHDFAYRPPRTAKLVVPQPEPDPESLLLPVGVRAPDFKLQTINGETRGLSVIAPGAKVVLINFWFYG